METTVCETVALTDAVIATAAAADQVEEDVVIRIEAGRVRRLIREQLDPIEQRVIIWRFGIAGAPKLTLREVGDRLGFSAAQR